MGVVTMQGQNSTGEERRKLPVWVPDAARLYLSHTDDGVSLRALARHEGVHASTVLRRVRRYENRRDDLLVDLALDGLRTGQDGTGDGMQTGQGAEQARRGIAVAETDLQQEARRVLGRMAESAAILAVSADMDHAVVLRQGAEGKAQRLCTVERAVAEAFALKDWITCDKPGRVSSYRLTVAGRAALRRMTADPFDAPFGAQHRHMDTRDVMDDGARLRVRMNSAESPISMLGRKRDKDGKPYLDADLVRVAEKLREDFELAQMGPRVAQNWDRFLTAGDRGGFRPGARLGEGPRAARERVLRALTDLGPGLGDVVLRVCCFVEGIETAERDMGWAARSGKIVLRIALQRLKRHYDEVYGPSGPLFG